MITTSSNSATATTATAATATATTATAATATAATASAPATLSACSSTAAAPSMDNLLSGGKDTGSGNERRLGYIRVSTREQNEARQVDALNQFGVDKVYMDKQSGKDFARPAYCQLLADLKEGEISLPKWIQGLAQHRPLPQGHLAVQRQLRRQGASVFHSAPDRGRDQGGVHPGGEQTRRRPGVAADRPP